MSASYPVSNQRNFNAFFARAYAAVGAALTRATMAPPAVVTFTTASNPLRNDTTRSYFTTSGTAQTVTVISGMTEVAIGETITVSVLGAGVTTIAAGSGVTLVKKAATLKSDGINSVIRIIKTAANTYLVSGDLSAT